MFIFYHIICDLASFCLIRKNNSFKTISPKPRGKAGAGGPIPASFLHLGKDSIVESGVGHDIKYQSPL
jgi:hypothetical protein